MYKLCIFFIIFLARTIVFFICSMICQLHSFHQTAECFRWNMLKRLWRIAGMTRTWPNNLFYCNVIVILCAMHKSTPYASIRFVYICIMYMYQCVTVVHYMTSCRTNGLTWLMWWPHHFTVFLVLKNSTGVVYPS